LSDSRANRILIVDDEEDLVLALKTRFLAAGYEVEVAHDGLEALKKGRSLDPDLIILDVMLPRMDGFKVCRLLKFDKRYAKIPILLLSARGREMDQNMGISVGADYYMTKPFDSALLLKKARELITNSDLEG